MQYIYKESVFTDHFIQRLKFLPINCKQPIVSWLVQPRLPAVNLDSFLIISTSGCQPRLLAGSTSTPGWKPRLPTGNLDSCLFQPRLPIGNLGSWLPQPRLLPVLISKPGWQPRLLSCSLFNLDSQLAQPRLPEYMFSPI